MPPAIIPAIISAVVGVTEIGLQASGALTPDSPKIGTTPLTATQNAGQKAAVTQQLPNLQSLTGGSLSPEYAAQFGATQSGFNNDPQATGNIQAAINQFFGLTAPGQSGLNSSGTTSGGGGGIMDLLKPPGGSSGPPGMTTGDGLSNWIQQQLQGNSFQGLAA